MRKTAEKTAKPVQALKRKVLVFASGLMGELTLKLLASRGRFPEVASNPPESMRRRATGKIFSLSDKFKIYETGGAKFSHAEGSLPEADCAVTIDWAKDFFHGCPAPYPVYHTHPSLLPLYRGYGAISEQFLRGVKISGLTAYLDGEGIDAGDIVFQEKIKISYGDIPADFIRACAASCARFIGMLEDGAEFEARPQNHEKGFYMARTRGRQTVIDFNASAGAVYNFITAYAYPFSGAVFYHGGAKCRATRCAVEKWAGEYGEPGMVTAKSDYGIEVACGEGTVVIGEIYKNGLIKASRSDIEPGDTVY